MSKLKKIVAKNLRVRRAERDVSRRKLADMSGISIDAIGKYERGENAPSLETACTLAVALGCTPNDLCGWNRQGNKEGHHDRL